MRVTRFRPVFVEEIPSALEEGSLYVSIRYRTASHLCACGCRSKVVTPIKPVKWSITYDGESASLAPSIDRSQSSCGSHYWIRRDHVAWYPKLTVKQAARTRQRDASDLSAYYSKRGAQEPTPATTVRVLTRRLITLVRRIVQERRRDR